MIALLIIFGLVTACCWHCGEERADSYGDLFEALPFLFVGLTTACAFVVTLLVWAAQTWLPLIRISIGE